MIRPGEIHWAGQHGFQFFAVRDKVLVGCVTIDWKEIKARAMGAPVINTDNMSEVFLSIQSAKEAVEKALEKC